MSTATTPRSPETSESPKLLRPSARDRTRALVERCAQLLLEMASPREARA